MEMEGKKKRQKQEKKKLRRMHFLIVARTRYPYRRLNVLSLLLIQ